jgi:hypothetical protein
VIRKTEIIYVDRYSWRWNKQNDSAERGFKNWFYPKGKNQEMPEPYVMAMQQFGDDIWFMNNIGIR